MGFFSRIYNPSEESANDEQVVAARWELLRRNATFQKLARQWIESREFRITHADTPEYHNQKTHWPRCALDWMLVPSERLEVAHAQLERNRIFTDLRFNFGPIRCRQLVTSLELVRRRGRESIEITTVRSHTPLRLDDTWQEAPRGFRHQFRFAVLGRPRLQEIQTTLGLLGDDLRRVAHRLGKESDEAVRTKILESLCAAGDWCKELSEFSRIFAIPNATYTPSGLNAYFEQIRKVFRDANQYDAVARYNRLKSFLGSAEDWKWFLTAEHHRLDWRKSAGLYKLAILYSEDLKAQGRQRRKNAKPRLNPGSAVFRNRRSTVRRHCQSISDWSEKMYPPII